LRVVCVYEVWLQVKSHITMLREIKVYVCISVLIINTTAHNIKGGWIMVYQSYVLNTFIRRT